MDKLVDEYSKPYDPSEQNSTLIATVLCTQANRIARVLLGTVTLLMIRGSFFL